MKQEKRPWMLLYLLVGVLVLSTGLNFYFLLQLDNRGWDQELKHEFQDPAPDSRTLTLGLPEAPAISPDSVSTY